jgi:hypothetical protein
LPDPDPGVLHAANDPVGVDRSLHRVGDLYALSARDELPAHRHERALVGVQMNATSAGLLRV